MESEFITLDKAGEEAEWLRNFLEDIPYWPKPVAPVCIHCDSQAAIGRAGSMMYNGKSRHIRRRHNTVRELLSSGIITIDYVKSKDNVSDPLTKGLSREGVERTSKGMGLRPRTSQHGEGCTISDCCFRKLQLLNKNAHCFVKRLIGASKKLPEVSTSGRRLKWNFAARNHSWEKHRAGYCIVVEYVSGGTLRSHLLKKQYSQEKTTNLVLDKEGRVKIIDFGISRVEASSPINMTAETGTIGYMAPEVLIGLPYDHKCDVYSFGICLWEIYSCSIPYSGLSPHASSAMYKSRRPEIPNTCPSALANIMKQCWEDDPKKRPEMQEIVLMLEVIDTQKKSKGCFCFK
ncbi:hypothetical protein CQW23_30735 [Capsicum baccatum]|uniref:Protein kinase domain-containing protein n=1 Tax=Capsicum baccatum TaxID=33114 RepID=A0A2G2V9J8_CAPBA|nr:hypothetical protein CQW23_30735 [Capsicum baccatum]